MQSPTLSRPQLRTDVSPERYSNHPIIDAIRTKNLDWLTALIEDGTDVNKFYTFNGYYLTPLLFAVKYYNADPRIVEYLLKKGADPNVMDSYGRSPLHITIASIDMSSIDIFNLLMKYNAAVNIKYDEVSCTPLQIADCGYKIQLLCEADADIDILTYSKYKLSNAENLYNFLVYKLGPDKVSEYEKTLTYSN